MKYIDGFRKNREGAAYLKQRMGLHSKALEKRNSPVTLMEVCGSHTMSIHQFGIRSMLPEGVKLVSGPGCPVCVTDAGYLDTALELANQGHIIASFGDLMKVPSSRETLGEARSRGQDIRICYSPLDALEIARRHPDSEVIFLAIGFETTVPSILTSVVQAKREGINNYSLLIAFKLVPPALEALLQDPDLRLDGFLCPGHVSAIIGSNAYAPIVKNYAIPCVVAGFEPLDILFGLEELIAQVLQNKAQLVNQYERVVRDEGNLKALDLMAQTMEPCDAAWRGIGVIPGSGLRLKGEFEAFDARRRFGVEIALNPGKSCPDCDSGVPDACETPGSGMACGDVLKGKIEPKECDYFANQCTPLRPLGPCMVSAEGSCAAHFRYSRHEGEGL